MRILKDAYLILMGFILVLDLMLYLFAPIEARLVILVLWIPFIMALITYIVICWYTGDWS